MAKTVYSLVLDDEVMKLVDKAARRGGLSRSAYINQALAENVGYETALKKNADLFRCVEDLLARHDNLHFFTASSSAATVTGSISYRYKPTMKYLVEIYPYEHEYLGELKVSSRTGNEFVRRAIDEFFRLWAALERRYVSENIPCAIEENRMRRVFLRPRAEIRPTALASAIAHYIGAFDALINEYFVNLDSDGFSVKEIEYAFRKEFYGKPVI